MKNIFSILVLFFSVFVFSQHRFAYQIFDSKGKKTTYGKLLKTSDKSELILFGEYHDNPISHWLELTLAKDLYQKKSLVLGAEMIEKDNQDQLNKYLLDQINQKVFDTLARLWNNYTTDYKPLVDFAKKNKLDFIATNIPRKYASLVYRNGFEVLDTLSENEKKWIANLPIKYDETLSQYQKMLEMAQGHAGDNFPKAQAIKDATMGNSIVDNLRENTIFIHYHGSFHSDFYQGIYWYVKQERPNLKITTIATVSQENLSKLNEEHIGRADFIIVVDQDMTKTF